MSSENTKYIRTKAFVFDLDGTLIDTTPLILETSHGVRTIETISKWAPHKATPDYITEFEKNLADEWEGVSILPGITTLLQKIPSDKWGIFIFCTYNCLCILYNKIS
ncbi:hypothetical protein INT48_006958, partial [Thamnidium elegans]